MTEEQKQSVAEDVDVFMEKDGCVGIVTKSVYAVHKETIQTIFKCFSSHVVAAVFHIAPASPDRLRVTTMIETRLRPSVMSHVFQLGTNLDTWLLENLANMAGAKKRAHQTDIAAGRQY